MARLNAQKHRYVFYLIPILLFAFLWKADAQVPERWQSTLESGCDHMRVIDLKGDFESVEEGALLAGWTLFNSDNCWTGNAQAARSGQRGLRFSADKVEKKPRLLMSSPFEVSAGDAVAYYYWVRCVGGQGKTRFSARVQVKREKAWKDVAPAIFSFHSSSWREYGGVPAIIPAGVTQARLLFAVAAENTEAVWDMDDLCVWVTSLNRYVAQRKKAQSKPLENFVIFGIDTLCQDTLGAYGARRNHTPTFDQIAAEGRLYEEVTSPCPWTSPSWASLLTSLYPSRHKAEFRVAPITESIKTLPEILREQGYFTVGIVTSSNLDGLLGETKGFHRGFDVFFQYVKDQEVAQVLTDFLDANSEALSGYKQGGIFIFWHSYEPHLTYENRYPNMIRNRGGELGTIDISDKIVMDYFVGGKEITEPDLEYIKAVYDSEVIAVDDRLRDYRLRLQRYGLWEDLNVVVCSDHGEAFAENDCWKHGRTWETIVRTPLLFRLPGRIKPGERIEKVLVSNLDIMPTLLDVAGISAPDYLEGRSLLQARPDAQTALYGISESKISGWLSIRDLRYKLVVSNVSNRTDLPIADRQNPAKVFWTVFGPESEAVFALYDLDQDPGEERDLSQSKPELLERLKQLLKEHLSSLKADAFEAAPAAVESKETLEVLRALGYL